MRDCNELIVLVTAQYNFSLQHQSNINLLRTLSYQNLIDSSQLIEYFKMIKLSEQLTSITISITESQTKQSQKLNQFSQRIKLSSEKQSNKFEIFPQNSNQQKIYSKPYELYTISFSYYIIFTMNNSSLVNNTDRIYGENDPLKSARGNEYQDTESECVIWIKITLLIMLTYGLIVAFYAMSWAIQKNNNHIDSFNTGGGIILGIFLVYVIIVAFAWYKGYQKRDVLKREAIEKQLQLEREAA